MTFFHIAVSLFLLLSPTFGGLARGESGVLPVDRFKSGVNGEGLPLGWKLEKAPGPNSKYGIEKEKEDYFEVVGELPADKAQPPVGLFKKLAP